MLKWLNALIWFNKDLHMILEKPCFLTLFPIFFITYLKFAECDDKSTLFFRKSWDCCPPITVIIYYCLIIFDYIIIILNSYYYIVWLYYFFILFDNCLIFCVFFFQCSLFHMLHRASYLSWIVPFHQDIVIVKNLARISILLIIIISKFQHIIKQL